VYRADSRDGGVTWGDAARTALVNPDSKIAALGLADGRILLAFNDQQAKTQGTEDVDKGLAVATKRRDTLVIAVSSFSPVPAAAAGGGGGGVKTKLHVFARLDDGKAGLMVHYPTLVVPASDPGKVLVTYTRSYNNLSTAPSPREDGIWLAEMDIPKLGEEEGVGGVMGEAGYPVRSMAIVGPGENGHKPLIVDSGGGHRGHSGRSGAAGPSVGRLFAAMTAAHDALASSASAAEQPWQQLLQQLSRSNEQFRKYEILTYRFSHYHSFIFIALIVARGNWFWVFLVRSPTTDD
jgi:hypothetical protein